jgi:hypothetical protein
LGKLPMLRSIGLGKQRDLRPFAWHWFDWSDPGHPALSAEAGRA